MIDNFQIEEMVEQTQRYVSYKGYNTQSGRKCLLKRYLVDESTGLGRIEGWQEEFLSIIDEFNKLEVPSLRSLIGGGLDPQDGNPYAVFEWLEVSSLSEVIQDNQNLDLALTKDMTKAALDAIGFLHTRGWVHGDISPQCVFYTDSKEKNPWVLNWDPIRSLRCKHGVNRFGMNIYMAPELSAGSPSNVQTDLYALGKTAGKVAGPNAQEPHFMQWVSIMSAMEPDHRYQSAEQSLEHMPTEEAAPKPARPEPAPSRLLVPASPPATPTAPVVTAAASQPKAQVSPRNSGVQKTQLKSAKPKSNTGIIVGVSVMLLLLLGGGLMLLGKKEEPMKATVSSPVDGLSSSSNADDVFNEESFSAKKTVDTISKPEAASPISQESVLAEVADGSVILASDFTNLDKKVDKVVTVQGDVLSLTKVEDKLHLYLTDSAAPDVVCKITVEERRRSPFPALDELNAQFVGKRVRLEGDLFRKYNNAQKIYTVYARRITDVVDASTKVSILKKNMED